MKSNTKTIQEIGNRPTIDYVGKPGTKKFSFDSLVKSAIDSVLCASIFVGACLYANQQLEHISVSGAHIVTPMVALIVLAILFDHRRK